MAASPIELVMAQVRASLLGATDAGTRVERGRPDPFAREELPAINVRRAPSSTEAFGDGVDKVTVLFDVDCEVRGADWETSSDALHGQVEAALQGSTQLKQMLRGLRCISTDPNGEGGDETSGRLTCRYTAYFLQRRL